MKVDLHLHSSFSFDGKADMAAVCQAAAEKGFAEICFTEHTSVNLETCPTYYALDYAEYARQIDVMRDRYAGRLRIQMGIELCEPHAKPPEMDLWMKGKPFDVVLGAVHNLDGLSLRRYAAAHTAAEAYSRYFEEEMRLAKHADMDVLAHLDLMKRYAFAPHGNYGFADYCEIITEILKVILQRGIALEVNTSGLRNDVRELFPKLEILTAYRQMGGERITLGSDAHTLQDMGHGLQETQTLLRSLGYGYICVFENRTPRMIALA